uniref:Queuine tRNA-ribosyltransferase catalytic subunit 1 n=1 Tax=Meloidogyne enterolobii TaxID=390850 RepID=A0A6V7VSV5_MELEN|nr:unnamed protein product [Meloidogyne enterolobii]
MNIFSYRNYLKFSFNNLMKTSELINNLTQNVQNNSNKPVERRGQSYQVIATQGPARYGKLELPHGIVETPVFMPVGTQGSMKGISPEQLIEMDCQILLCNTYHLGHRPGHKLIEEAGGLHKFMHWPRPILTDSGGFQMVSLSKLMEITEEGVNFESPHTKEMTMLTPEYCVEIQEAFGSDIMMQLDHVIPSLTEGPIVEEAMRRSVRWLDRCTNAQKRQTECALFPIVQGGLDIRLREECVKEMVPRAKLGIAIGGLSGGEAKDTFWKVVARCCELIPPHLPRYVMGVGWSVDLVVASALGADMFDCVYPTRTARFGTAITRREGDLHLNQARFKTDLRPIDEECKCQTCKKGYSRAFLNATIGHETVACHLISIHNLFHHMDLMRRLRKAINEKRLNEFLSEFLREQYKEMGNVPKWVRDALNHAGHNWEF